MVDALAKGDEVVTVGGMLGKISKIGDNYLGLKWPMVSTSRSAQCGGSGSAQGAASSHEPLPGLEVRDHPDRAGGGGLYALPNVFGEAPAVQVSVAKSSVKLDAAVLARVEEAPQGGPPLRPMPLRWMPRRCGPVSPVPMCS